MIDEVLHTLMMEIAFVQGAKWWEYQKTEFTMWQSDQDKAADEALRRAKNGTLGKLAEWEKP